MGHVAIVQSQKRHSHGHPAVADLCLIGQSTAQMIVYIVRSDVL